MYNKNKMKNSIIIASLFLFLSCQNSKDLLPSLARLEYTDLYPTSVFLTCDFEEKNGDIISKGFCWSTNPEPTINDSIIDLTNEIFESKIANLQPNTDYSFRAYASNIEGISYSEIIQIRTVNVPIAPCNTDVNIMDFGIYEIDVTNFDITITQKKYEVYINEGAHILRLRFKEHPETKEYKIASSGNIEEGKSECLISVNFPTQTEYGGNSSFDYFAEDNQKVYVEKIGEDIYQIEFCNLLFHTIGHNYSLELSSHLLID